MAKIYGLYFLRAKIRAFWAQQFGSQLTGSIQAIVLGNPDKIQTLAGLAKSWDLSKLTVRDPANDDIHAKMVASFVERRKGKATPEQAEKIVQDANYFGTMLVYMKEADGTGFRRSSFNG